MRAGCIRMKYSLYASSHTGKYTAPPYLHLALGHRWPWDQVGGARVGRGTVALRYLGCLPTITSSISGVKDAQRSRRQSIWAVYTSLRHTAKYTGFGCISYVYSPLASSRLACHAIQHIQHIQHIQPYTPYIIQRYTASLSECRTVLPGRGGRTQVANSHWFKNITVHQKRSRVAARPVSPCRHTGRLRSSQPVATRGPSSVLPTEGWQQQQQP